MSLIIDKSYDYEQKRPPMLGSKFSDIDKSIVLCSSVEEPGSLGASKKPAKNRPFYKNS